MAPKGRRAKSKSRITAYEKLMDQESERLAKDLEIYIPPGPRLGNRVIQAKGVSKGYGDKLLVENMEFSLPPGGIVGVIGPNGAGKTTLFRMITGQDQPDSGSVAIGETVSLAYVDQSRDVLDPQKNIWETVSGGQDTIALGDRQVNSRAYVARFNFSGSDQQKKWACFPAVNATGCTWHAYSNQAPTCFCWTNPPMTWMSTRCEPWKRPWKISAGAPWSSAMTAGSWTASPPTCWPSRATARWSGLKATTPTTKKIVKIAWVPLPISPIASNTGS
jgi:sulfate-transporting ATPase